MLKAVEVTDRSRNGFRLMNLQFIYFEIYISSKEFLLREKLRGWLLIIFFILHQLRPFPSNCHFEQGNPKPYFQLIENKGVNFFVCLFISFNGVR